MTMSVTGKDSVKQKPVTQNKLAYSVEEISEQTSLSKPFLRNEIRAGRLKAKLFGRRVLILKEDWTAYADDKEIWKSKSE